MDFHTLTKKQANTLCQIAKRGTVSTFFEPLLIVRELEALRLINLVQSEEFDSGLGYQLNHAGKVLATKPAGTEYCADQTYVIIRYEPEPEPDCSEELRKKERECVDLQNQLQTAKNNIAWYERELEKVKAEVNSIQAANHRQYDTIMEKNTVICNLQRTVNDYAGKLTAAERERDEAKLLAQARWENGKRLNDQLQVAAVEHNRLVDKVGRLRVQLKGFSREPMQVFRYKHGDTPGLFLKVGEAICCDNICADKKVVVYQNEDGELFWRDLADFDDNFEVLP